MFACIYGQPLAKIKPTSDDEINAGEPLVNLAFSFSPLIEQTTIDTVVLDIEGQEHLFHPTGIAETNKNNEWSYKIADQITRCAQGDGLKVNVAVASNPDAAIHAARALNGITIIPQGNELTKLGNLSLKLLDYSLVRIDDTRADEIRETFALWGLRTFGDFARLPIRGVAQRLGQEGVRLQKLARGINKRHLVLVQPPIGFEQSLELEHAITELEPLSFILSRLLNQLCANLDAHALATSELRLSLVTESAALGSCSTLEDQISTESGSDRMIHDRTITLPLPMRNSKMFLRLCLLDLESHPPPAPVTAISIIAEPTKPRVLQNGLFIPQAPEPEKLELTLARLAKLVGEENVGSPELLDTHRPDAFRMKRFDLSSTQKNRTSNPQSVILKPSIVGFRRFRPPLPAQVITKGERPMRISARKLASSDTMRGKILQASGPWRTSGDWWRPDVWARDEWDVAVADANGQSEILCRIFRDLASEDWFVEGIYD